MSWKILKHFSMPLWLRKLRLFSFRFKIIVSVARLWRYYFTFFFTLVFTWLLFTGRHWSPSDSKSPQFSTTLLRVLAKLHLTIDFQISQFFFFFFFFLVLTSAQLWWRHLNTYYFSFILCDLLMHSYTQIIMGITPVPKPTASLVFRLSPDKFIYSFIVLGGSSSLCSQLIELSRKRKQKIYMRAKSLARIGNQFVLYWRLLFFILLF